MIMLEASQIVTRTWAMSQRRPTLYGGVIAKDRAEAAKLAESVSTGLSTKILKSVLDYISIREFTNQSKIGLHGFCFGGTHAFNFVCESKKIVSSSYLLCQSPSSRRKLSNIVSPLLIVYGEQRPLHQTRPSSRARNDAEEIEEERPSRTLSRRLPCIRQRNWSELQ